VFPKAVLFPGFLRASRNAFDAMSLPFRCRDSALVRRARGPRAMFIESGERAFDVEIAERASPCGA